MKKNLIYLFMLSILTLSACVNENSTTEVTATSIPTETMYTTTTNEPFYYQLSWDGDYNASFHIENSWQKGNYTVYKCHIDLTNPTDKKISNWQLEITFNDNVKLEDHWNGDFNLNGNKLIITPDHYNKDLEPSGKLENIGFEILIPNS